MSKLRVEAAGDGKTIVSRQGGEIVEAVLQYNWDGGNAAEGHFGVSLRHCGDALELRLVHRNGRGKYMRGTVMLDRRLEKIDLE